MLGGHRKKAVPKKPAEIGLPKNNKEKLLMKWTEPAAARTACAYFFMCPGLAYGMLTSRLPAMKAQTGADEAQIGFFLLCFGMASLVSLFASGWLIARWGSRLIIRAGAMVLMASVPLCGLAANPLQLGAACALAGLGMGLTDVSINAQGIQIEQRYRKPCMAFMHASYSLGGMTGALTGALFAGLDRGLFANAACVLGVYACLCPLAMKKLVADAPPVQDRKKGSPASGLPVFVVMCGILSMFAYAAEGSAGEWGSLLLFSSKGASESLAACAFAVFSAATIGCRLFGDRLRGWLGDFVLAIFGASLAACGMSLVLFSPDAAICLFGYALMGTGLAPPVPILFSRAGSWPGIDPGKASAVVSTLSYSGLLFFPPSLGFIASRHGLQTALLLILLLCIFLFAGAFLLKTPSGRKNRQFCSH